MKTLPAFSSCFVAKASNMLPLVIYLESNDKLKKIVNAEAQPEVEGKSTAADLLHKRSKLDSTSKAIAKPKESM